MLVNQFGNKIPAAGGGGGGSTPADIASTEWWWDCNDTANIFTDDAMTTAVGASEDTYVRAVADKSGNGYDLTSQGDVTTYLPLWKPAAYPEGLYLSANDGLRSGSATTEAATAGDDLVVFGVAKALNSGTMAIASHAKAAFGWKLGFTNVTTPRFAVGNGSGSSATVSNTISTVLLTRALFAFNFDNSANTIEGFINGTSVGTPTAASFDIGYNSADRLCLGAMTGAAQGQNVNGWVGYIDEVVGMVNPSAADIAAIETYLLNKYSL